MSNLIISSDRLNELSQAADRLQLVADMFLAIPSQRLDLLDRSMSGLCDILQNVVAVIDQLCESAVKAEEVPHE